MIMLTSNKFIPYLQTFKGNSLMKGNIKLALMAGLTIISLMVMSVSTFNFEAKAQSQNQTSPQLSQDVQKRLAEYHKNSENWLQNQVRISPCHRAAISPSRCKNFRNPAGLKLFHSCLPQLLDLGINQTSIKQLQTGSNDLPGLVQKFKILADLIP